MQLVDGEDRRPQPGARRGSRSCASREWWSLERRGLEHDVAQMAIELLSGDASSASGILALAVLHDAALRARAHAAWRALSGDDLVTVTRER